MLIFGKLPPPFIGPAIATEILVHSDILNRHFELSHFNTTINSNLAGMGRFSPFKLLRVILQYMHLCFKLAYCKPAVALLPISQTGMGFLKDSVFILLCRFFSSTRIIVQLRGSNFSNWFKGSSPAMQRYVRRILRRAFGVIVLGENLRHIFEPFFPPARIFVIPNGGNFPIPPRSGMQDNCIRLLWVSNFLPSKGFFDVLLALSRLNDKKGEKKFHLKALGAWYDSAFQKKCEELIKSRKLPVEIITSDAGREEKYLQLANADIFIFTPVAPEGHPWVIVEALAAGLPVIATAMGAIEQSVVDGKNGFIVPVNEPDAIAAKILELASEPGRLKEMGQCSRALYQKRFTEEIMTAAYIEVFEKARGNYGKDT